MNNAEQLMNGAEELRRQAVEARAKRYAATVACFLAFMVVFVPSFYGAVFSMVKIIDDPLFFGWYPLLGACLFVMTRAPKYLR